MAEVKVGTLYRVDIIESERGWGQKLDEIKYFDNEPEARAFCKIYNATNTFFAGGSSGSAARETPCRTGRTSLRAHESGVVQTRVTLF